MITIVLLVISALLILLGLKLLLKKDWLIQFLRGFAGFGLLLIAFLLTMSGLNITSYSQLAEGQPIANVSFVKLNEQSFQTTVVNVQTGVQQEFSIDGDQWQVDARVLRLSLAGKTPFYKLERISGRYYSLEQERSNLKSAYQLNDNSIGFDLWSIFKGKNLGLIKANYGSATYMPMADGATFSVEIGVSGLQVKPVNDQAKHIVNEWQ